MNVIEVVEEDQREPGQPEPESGVVPCPVCGGDTRVCLAGYFCEDGNCPGVAKANPDDPAYLAEVERRVREIDGVIDGLEEQRDGLQAILNGAKARALLKEAEGAHLRT